MKNKLLLICLMLAPALVRGVDPINTFEGYLNELQEETLMQGVRSLRVEGLNNVQIVAQKQTQNVQLIHKGLGDKAADVKVILENGVLRLQTPYMLDDKKLLRNMFDWNRPVYYADTQCKRDKECPSGDLRCNYCVYRDDNKGLWTGPFYDSISSEKSHKRIANFCFYRNHRGFVRGKGGQEISILESRCVVQPASGEDYTINEVIRWEIPSSRRNARSIEFAQKLFSSTKNPNQYVVIEDGVIGPGLVAGDIGPQAPIVLVVPASISLDVDVRNEGLCTLSGVFTGDYDLKVSDGARIEIFSYVSP